MPLPTDPYRRAAQEQADAERLVAQQQRTAERLANAQAKQAAREQKAAADAARKAELSRQELEYRKQGMIPVTTADGNLHPDPLWDQKQAEKADKEKEAAAKAAQEQQAAKISDQFTKEGRKFFTSKVTGMPVALESDAQLEQQRKDRAEQARKNALDERLRAVETATTDPEKRRLPAKARENIARQVKTAKQEALFALQSSLQEKAKGTDKAGWYDVVNNNPTPEALAAKERLTRLSQPDADLTDEDLADLEANDATKPLAEKIRNASALLAKDDQAAQFHEQQAATAFDLKLRRDDPAAWAERQRQRRASMTPEQLAADLESSSADLTARGHSLNDAFAPIQARRTATQQKLDDLRQQAAQRRQQGLTAGEMVTMTNPDGASETWPADLAAQFEKEQALHQQAEAQDAPILERIIAQRDELLADEALHNEAATRLNEVNKVNQVQQTQSALRRFAFTPGMEQTGQELDALASEAQTRQQVLAEMHPEGIPQEALDALNADIQSKTEALITAGEAKLQGAAQAAAQIRQRLDAREFEGKDASPAYAEAAAQLAQQTGITPEEAQRLITDAESATDWSNTYGRHNEQGDTPGQTRLLSNGGIVVNPSITDKAAYEKAVAASGGTPEAQADAIARYPQVREAAAKQVLESIQEIGSVFGPGAIADYTAYAAKRPGDLSEAEWAMRYVENEKANARSDTWNTLKSITREAWASLNQGAIDLRQQASGLLGGLTGSETLLQDAQWAGRKADALQQAKVLSGDQSTNVAASAAFSSIPRLAGSILPAAGGAKAIAGGVRLFAGTSLGSRLFPSLAAAIEGSATPAQAAKAVDTLTRAGLGGASAAGAAQTYGAQIADIYGTLRREHPELSHAEALQQAQAPAVVSALATAALTTLGGSSGVERLFTRPQEARAAFDKVFASRLQQAGFVGKEFLKGGLKESFIEELPDEMISQIAAAVGTGKPVQQALAEFLQQLPELALATTALGGAGQGIESARESSVSPAQTPTPQSSIPPEVLASAESAIDGLQIPEVDEATLARTQDAARGVLYIAQGTPLTEMDADTLAALDIVEDPQKPGTFVNGRIVPGKNGVPELQTFDAGQAPVANADGTAGMRPVRVRMIDGQPVISQSTLDKLSTLLPAVRAAIPLDEKQRLQQLQQPATADTAANQAPAQPAQENPVQGTPVDGLQPPPSGQNTAPPAVSDAGTPARTGPATEQRATELATLLESRGLTAPQALHAARKVVEAQGVVGASAEEQYAAGIDDELYKVGWIKPQTRKKYEFFGRGTPPTSDAPSDAGTPARTAPVEDATDPFTVTKVTPVNPVTTTAPTGDLADRVVVAKQRAMKAVPVASRKRFVKFVSPLTTHLARFQKAFPGGVVFTDAKGQNDLSYTGAGIVVAEASTNPRLEVNLAELFQSADHLDEKDLAAFTRRAVMHEVRHLAALKVITPGQARALWKDLTPALQARVYASYYAADLQNATGGKPLSQKQLLSLAQQAVTGVNPVNKVTLPKADPFHMAHEFLRMLDEDAEFAGQTSEAMDASPALGQAILDFLRSVLDEIKRLIATDLDQSTRVQLREFQKLVEAARKQILADNPADRLGSTKEASAAPLTTAADSRAGVTDKTDKTPVRTDFNPVRGSTGTAYTDSNDAIEFQWAVADVNSLNISNLDNGRINPDYPQELQPRDRTSAASEAQVNDIAKNFNLDRLSASSSVGDGAPIVGPDTVVESGNGRVMGARRAHATGKPSAEAYRAALIARAGEFGLNAEQIEAVPNPVLIRIRTTEVNRTAFVLAANVSTIAPKREMEQAKIDSKQIVPDLFDSFVPAEDGEIFTAANADFIRGFVSAVIPPAERGQVIDASGNLSQSGLRRIRNALFVHAYGTSPEALNALGRLTESIDATDTGLARSLLAMAPRFAEQNARIASGALYPFSITENLAQSLQKLADLRARGEKVETWLAQDRIPGIGDDPGPVTTALVQFLHNNRQRPRQILDALDRYAKALDGAGDPRQISLFGDEKPNALTLWNLAANYKEPALAMAAKAVLSDRLTPAIRVNGVLYTDGVTHWDIMESYVWRNKIPAWQRNEAEDRQIARDWIEKNWKSFHPTVEEGFAEDGRFLSREAAFKKLLRSPEGPALKQYVEDSGGDGRTWLDSGDLDYLAFNNTLAKASTSPTLPLSSSPPLPPASALKLYRKLTAQQAEKPLTPPQSQALERAERSLGQLFLFDEPNRTLKPAEDLVLEQQTASRATFADSTPEQLRLFMATKKVLYSKAAKEKHLRPITRQLVKLRVPVQDALVRVVQETIIPKIPPRLRALMDQAAADYNAWLKPRMTALKPQWDAYKARFTPQIVDAYNDNLEAIARDLGVMPMTRVPLKGDRGMEKAILDASERSQFEGREIAPDVTTVNDVLRASLVAADDEGVARAVEAIRARFKVVKFKDRFTKPVGGYHDWNFIVEVAPGLNAEVQVHRIDYLFAKEIGPGHLMYEDWRRLKELVRINPDPEIARFFRRVSKAMEMYYTAIGQAFAISRNISSSIDTPSFRTSRLEVTSSPALVASIGTGGSPSLSQATGIPSTSKNSVVGGNEAGTFTSEDTTLPPETQRITTENVREMNPQVDVSDLVGRQKDWRNAFTFPEGSRMLPLSKVIATKHEPQAVANATRLIGEALRGLRSPRKPVDASANPDGTFTLQDGNATAQALMLAGWKAVPGNLVEAPILAKASTSPSLPVSEPLPDIPGWSAFQKSLLGLDKPEREARTAAYHQQHPDAQAALDARKSVIPRIGRPIPPAWTDVQIFPPGSRLLAKGRDDKGRLQSIYSSADTQAALAAKFARQKRVNALMPRILDGVKNGLRAGTEEASVLRLIYLTGFRNGGEGDTGAKVKAYGATTLRAEHVSIDGDTVTFDFTGKLGVQQQHTIVDAALAADLAARKAKGGRLFNTSPDKVLAALRTAAGTQDIKVHDLRTWNATSLAADLIKANPTPETETDYWLKRDQIADVVARKLGDTRKIVLESYIDPIVFAKWQESLTLSNDSERPKISRKSAEARGAAGQLQRPFADYERSLRDELLPSPGEGSWPQRDRGLTLFKARTRVDSGPDLFGFNTGLGLDTLLTPRQKEAKVQQSQQLDLFGGLTDERPRPASPRPARPARPARAPQAPQQPAGFGELFATGLAGGTGGPALGALDQPGLPGGLGGGGNPPAGGSPTGDAGADIAAGNQPAQSPDSRVPGMSGVGQSSPLIRPGVGSPDRNFEVPAEVESLAPSTDKAKILANLEAIKLLKQLEAERRNATPEEKKKLAAYTGWGAFKEAFNSKYEKDIADYWDDKPEYQRRYMPDWLQSWEKNHRSLHKLLRENMSDEEFSSASASTLNAHYTAAPIIRSMWKMVERLGFKGGRALEPSAGAGHYLGLTPPTIADRTQWQTVELDDLSARLLSKLYPEATVNESQPDETRAVTGLGFERARIPNGSLDLIISNVPFHESGPRKKGFPALNLHNFFFAHALDKVKPGGLVAFITSESTMQNNMKQRDFIASKGDLVAAFRLPNNAFKGNAGTEVTTDIIILRKPDGTPFQGKAWRNLVEVGRQTITLVQGKDQTLEELRAEAARTGTIVGKEYWKNGKKAIEVSAPIMVNEYFVNHPQHALGTHTLASTMYRSGGYALVAPDGLDVPAALDALVPSLPADIIGTQQAADKGPRMLADRDDKPFSFKEQDGKIYEVQPDGSMEEAEWATNPAMVKTWRSWKGLSQAIEELVAAETSDASDDRITALRRRLNVLYDTHIATHKPVSRRFSNAHKHLYSDPGYPLTAALENEVVTVDPKTGKKTYTYKKADIFTKRIGRPIVVPSTAQNIDDALEKSLAWKGHIDTLYGSSLLGISPEAFTQQALQRPDIFTNPETGLLETGEEYLTGNVRVKLEAAETAALDDPKYQRNVEALRAAQPERKEIARISPVLGARWIPAEVYASFIKDVLQGNDTVEYIPAGNSWIISGSGLYRTEEHGTERKGPASLFKHALDMTEPMVYDGSGENRTFNATETAAAKTALDKMRRAFIDYVKTSDTQITVDEQTLPVWEAVENAFNTTQNSYVTPRHVGQYLQFPGLNTSYVKTGAHRRAVIARFLSTRRGMMAHGVGSGKTFAQVILAQELRRLGLAKKPVIVVQNSTLGQFAKSYLKAYPSANILVPTKRDFEAQNRKKLVAKIATGNWDAVILPHSQFDLISNKPEAVKAYMDSQIDELMGIVGRTKDKAKVRDLEGMLKRLRDRRQDMLDKLAARQDTAVMWEDLGIDALIMDEAHNYKSLPIVTRMGRVKGVPASSNSQRAINFMLKCRDVQAKTGGKNIFLATGTPIKNSMAEAYIMMQFMAPDVLEEFGIHNFDDFATTYGQTVTEAEMAWGGAPKMETRFAKFQNGASLVTMIRSMFDVAFGNEALGLDVPKIKGGEPEMLIVPATPQIDQFNAWTRSVDAAWKAADGKDKEEFTAVPIQTMAAGIAAAVDPRLISPGVEDHPQSKVNTAVRRVLDIYKAGTAKRTTQIIFSDLRNKFSMDYLMPFTGHPFPETGSDGEFDLYADIKRKLVAGGVPEKEVHLMQSGMTDVQKAALFEKVDNGEIRIIIGSTELLGVGVNIQTRLKAVHHLMPPRDFTPAMMEQRNGRIIRQGNLHAAKVEGQPAWNEEVEVVNYGTEGSMDSAIYGTLARKQRFITQLLMAEDVQDTFDDPTDPVAVNMAEMAARTLGDPDFIRRIELEKEIKDLRLQSDAFTNELSGKRSRLARLDATIANRPKVIEELQTTATRLASIWKRTAPAPEGVKEGTDISDKPVYQFGGPPSNFPLQTIDTAAKDGAITNKLDLFLLDVSKTAERRGQTRMPVGLTINGHPLTIDVQWTLPGDTTPGEIQSTNGTRIANFKGAASLIQNLRRAPADTAAEVERLRQDTEAARQQAEALRAKLATVGTFPDAAKLTALELESREVEERLRAKAAPPPSTPSTGSVESNLPDMTPVDPDLMTPEVESVIDNADIEGNKLFLPDQLDRKLYEKVNKALESAGGRWNKRAKAHVFKGDPRPYLGLAEMPATPSLAKASTQVYTPSSYDTAAPDPFTGIPSLITGQRLTREQGRAIGHAHAQRLRAGLPNRADSGNAGPALAANRAGTLNVSDAGTPARTLPTVPVLSPAQFTKLQKLPLIGEGAEAKVYADRERGTVYKVLQGYAPVPGVIGSSTLGVWPQVYYTAGGQLDYAFAPADRPRQLVVRLAVQTLVGGTPTEIVGIGPEGHIVLKQPLSPAPEIGRDDNFIDNSGLSIARNRAGLVEIPKALLADPQSPRVFLAVVEGRPWLLMDLHPDNFVGDNQAQGRINDAIVGQLTSTHLTKIPGLAQLVKDAAARARDLGDRSDRLFMATKRVDSPMASDSGAAQNAEPSPGGLSEADGFISERMVYGLGSRKAVVLYHGGPKIQKWQTNKERLEQGAFAGFHLTENEEMAKRYAANSTDSKNAVVTAYYARIPKLWDTRWQKGTPPPLESLPDWQAFPEVDGNKFRLPLDESEYMDAAAAGYDGVIGDTTLWDTSGNYTGLQVVVFDPQKNLVPVNPESSRAAGGTLAKASTSPSLPVSPSPNPLARLGWNHLDRALSAKLAALARWTDGRTGASQTVAKWTGAAPQKLRDAAHAIKREFFPDSVLPREILAKKREMEIKTAMGSQKAMDLVRALQGSPKFSTLAYPPGFAENPTHRRHLYEAMTGERDLATLPKEMQALAAKLRAILVEIGREAVKQGRMSTDTFDNLRTTYMPHFYEEDVQKEKSLFQRFRLGVRDILAQRTTAWHIEDTAQKDSTGQPRLVSHTGNQWRFRNQQHMDAFFEDFIQQQALAELQSRYGKKFRSLTAADLMTPSKLDPEVRGRLQEIKRSLHQRYKRQRPLTIAEQEKAGLIMDPVYAIARYTAQMAHDNSTAEFFNHVAAQPALVSDIATPGFTEIPDNPRFGRLAGKFVENDVAGQLLELIEAPGIALKIYDTVLGWWKTGKTVLNPGTHVRNVLGNLFFSQLAGNSVWNPGNATYYRQAIAALRQGGPVLTEAYDAGVLGADFVSAELRQTLRQLLPDPATIVEDGKAPSIMSGIGKAIGRFLGTPAGKIYNKFAALYQAEDEVFKLAAYLKAKEMLTEGSAGTPARSAAAAQHVRKWFPYFDSGTSGTLRLLGRTAMPFLGFYRESIRIFGHALKERPIALAAGLSVPSIITFFSAMALGLDDDDMEEIQKDMRGKAGKLLGPTPLEGMPLFSMLLWFRSDTGQVQQFDISAVHPFVDFLGNRVESSNQEDWWQKTLRSFIAAGPIGSLLYSQMTGRDAFGDRPFVEANMTGGEKALARLENAWMTAVPPLAGTGLRTLLNSGERSTNKTLEERSPTQAAVRVLGGLDVRNATPDLYRLADDWRKANGYEVTEGMDYGSTTPASRARKALFGVLAQDNPNPTAIKNILTALDKMGHPVRTEQDVNKLLFYRDPLKLIGGNKAKGITAPDAQAQFRASLKGEARAALENALQEYQRIKATAPSILARARTQ